MLGTASIGTSSEGHGSSFFVNSASGQNDIKQVLTMAREQLIELLQERATIVKRITTLRRTLLGLVEIFGDEGLGEELKLSVNAPRGSRRSGLTNACRSVLMNSGRPLSSGDVVTRIHSGNGDVLRNHKNPVVSVTSILYRLQSYGETTGSTNQDGKRVWMWIR